MNAPSAAAVIAYRHSVEAVTDSLGTHPQNGLTEAEARARLGRDGPNELTGEPPVPAWRRFVAQFQDITGMNLLEVDEEMPELLGEWRP